MHVLGFGASHPPTQSSGAAGSEAATVQQNSRRADSRGG